MVDGALISFNFSVMDIVHDEQWQQREHLRANLSLLGPYLSGLEPKEKNSISRTGGVKGDSVVMQSHSP